MEKATRACSKLTCATLLFLAMVLGTFRPGAAYSVQFTDSSGSSIVISERPGRVVSLVPEVSDIIFAIDAGDALNGLTLRDASPPEAARKAVVGGPSSPCPEKIEELHPDLIFLSSMHREVRERFAGRACHLVELRPGSLDDLYRTIEILGDIFEKRDKAAEQIAGIRDKLQLISRKVEKIPPRERKRLLRILGGDRVMVPGDDSPHRDFIRAVGGIPPEQGKKGEAVEVSLEEWKHLDPQVIYGCGGDREVADRLKNLPGWKDVQAVREGKVYYFPCELTNHFSLHTADFVAWLASIVYEESFGDASKQVLEEKATGSRCVELSLDYVTSAQVVESIISDFPNKTLVVEFNKPMRILSTLDGELDGITCVGNHGSPPPCWSIGHTLGLEGGRDLICKVLGKQRASSAFLMTGADMDNLAVRKAQFKDMIVYALVTAGVRGNAIRTSRDEGRFYEPGTINIILLTNRKLTARARARAVICATEAKSAALQDMDIRSSEYPLRWQATGTGTDEMIVVEGNGTCTDNTGGHCKMCELIAGVVYGGVGEAVLRQNGIIAQRSVLLRLRERGIGPSEILRRCRCLGAGNDADRDLVLRLLEEILLNPRYAAFLESALALSDAHERSQVADVGAFKLWAKAIAEEIAGGHLSSWQEIMPDDIPVITRISLDAVLNGLLKKQKEMPR